MPCNDFFFVDNQANLLLSHLLLAIEPSINLFSLVPVPQVSAGNFVLFGLMLLWLILCFTSACKHAIEWFSIPPKDSEPSEWICLILITNPNKVTVRYIARSTSQLSFDIHFYQAFYLVAYCQTLELMSCCRLQTYWLLVAFLKMYHPQFFYDSCIQHLKLKLGIPVSHWYLIHQVSFNLQNKEKMFSLKGQPLITSPGM